MLAKKIVVVMLNEETMLAKKIIVMPKKVLCWPRRSLP